MPDPVRVIDLRSDTVTRPTDAMRRAMMAAELGDDVLGDDPTVLALQERVAAMLGREAACFVPSGTMANQTAIRALTGHGDEILCDAGGHILHYESAAPAALSGCLVRPLDGVRGVFTPEQVRAAVRPDDHHCPRSRLVVIENTHNRGGGTVWPVEQVERVAAAAREAGLRVHLDGARLWNACVASGRRPAEYARFADTVSVCFSKGLGAPAGSAVAGTRETIRRVFFFRKQFGGAMRQSGLLAAAALHALDHHIDRLADDHANARRLAEGLASIPGLRIDPATVQTNIVFFEVDERLGSAGDFAAKLDRAGVRTFAAGPGAIRAVTHLDVTRDMIDHALRTIRQLAR